MLTLPADMNMVWIGVAIGVIVLLGVYLCRAKLPPIPGLSSLMAKPEKATSTEGLINKERQRKDSQKGDDSSSSDDDEN